jgi:hypothetical protein
MRKVLSILPLTLLAGCFVSDVNVTISNNCAGSYARVIDGSDHELIRRLDYGAPAVVVNVKEVSSADGVVRLTANGYTQVGDHPLGSTYTTITASSSPTQTTTGSWEIYSFNGSGVYYCR